MLHVRVLSQYPHPIGTSAEAGVRQYLIQQLEKLAMAPTVQSGTAVRAFGQEITAGLTHNIVGRLYGTGNSQAVLLVAHYDSVNHSPGASDDGIGVATILETVRAIEAGPRLQNDVIVLFTDGEEIGLLGAELFTSSHPWAKEARVALNFEARGDSGTVLMFETSNNSRWLIDEFSASVPRPAGSSLLCNIYKQLPNDTDFTLLRRSGLEGMNFAIGERLEAYHSSMDIVQNLHEASLQQMGDAALSLARDLGNSKLVEHGGRSGDDIFFDLLGLMLVRYPLRWALPLQVGLNIAILVALALAHQRGLLRGRAVLGAMLGVVACLGTVPAMLEGVWLLIAKAAHGRLLTGDAAPNAWLLLSVLAVGLGMTLYPLAYIRGKAGAANLHAAGLIAGAVVGLVVAFVLPAASYLIFWPLLAMCVGFMALSGDSSRPSDLRKVLVAWLGALPVLLLFCPVIFLLFVFLGLGMTLVGVLGALLPLLTATVAPLLDQLVPQGRGAVYVPVLCLISGLSLGSVGFLMSHFGPDHPYANSLLYSLDADHGKAFWLSLDAASDEWKSQYLGLRPERRKFPDYVSGINGLNREILWSEAPILALEAPVVDISTSESGIGVRTVSMHIDALQHANSITLAFPPQVVLLAADVNGKSVEVPGPESGRARSEAHVNVFGIAEADVYLTLKMRCGNPCRVVILGRSLELPAIPRQAISPRPPDKRPLALSDVSIIYRSYEF